MASRKFIKSVQPLFAREDSQSNMLKRVECAAGSALKSFVSSKLPLLTYCRKILIVQSL